jgi:signal transduction histidine kinase
VHKHSRATAVTVELKHTSPRNLLISVSDDGIGLPEDFDLGQLADEEHYGLLGISEYLALLGGNLSL